MSEIDQILKSAPAHVPGGAPQQAAQPESEIDSALKEAPTTARGFKGWGRDIAATALKGAIAVPEAIVGLADIPTGGRVGKFLENEGGSVGFRPKQAKEAVNDWHSDATKEAQRKFQEADGIGGKFKAAIENPSVIGTAVGESILPMFAGSVAARGLMAARGALAARGATQAGLGEAAAVKAAEQAAAKFAPYAGAAGEGLTMAGSAAEQIRQETPDGLLTPTQAGLVAATGLVGGAVGAFSGRMANRLGVGDAETMLAQGQKGMAKQFTDDAAAAAANPLHQQAVKGIPRRVIEGAISEGFLEELPQSVAEQVFQNVALGKDWLQDVDAAAVMGVLSGEVMGGAASGYHGMRQPAPRADGLQPPEQPPAQPGQPAPNDPAADAAPQPSPALQRIQQAYADQLAALQAQEQGEVLGPQSVPPDGAAVLAQQQAEEAARRQAAQEASRSVASPDDEIYQSTGATVPPSVHMGLDPAAGPLSAGAAIAVDTGVSGQMQHAAALAKASEQAAKNGKKQAESTQKQEQTTQSLQGVDPETGEIQQSGMAGWSDAQLSDAFRGAQSRDVRMQLARELSRRRAEREQQALQDELDAEQTGTVPGAERADAAFASLSEDAGPVPADLSIPTTIKGNTDVPQADQAQHAAAQPAQVGATPAVAGAAPDVQGSAGAQGAVSAAGVADGRPSTAYPGAQGTAASGAQAQAQSGKTEALRQQLRDVEAKILQAAPSAMGQGGGDIEAAMKSRKVPVTLKAKRQKLVEQVRASQEAEVQAFAPETGTLGTPKGGEEAKKQSAKEYLAEVAAANERAKESAKHAPREIIEPAKDTPAGVNANGDKLYDREDGTRYAMRHGRPDFGGDLAPAGATHADPGQAPEPATPAVVAQSVQKAARNEDVKPSAMRAWVLAEIDKAMLDAPEKDATEFVSFDVPGDGTFKVQKSRERLQAFRKQVQASPGFKDGGQKPNTQPPEQTDTVRNGSGSTVEAIRNFLSDGDVQGAVEFAKLKGVEFTPVEPRASITANGKFKRVPASVKSSVPSVAEGLTQVEAEQINQYLTAEQARAEPADAQDADVQQSPQDFIPAPDGGLDYGEITPEMGKAMRRQAGKIRLRRGDETQGLVHIAERHLDQFKKRGFESVPDFVASVAKSFTAIYKRDGAALDVVLEDGSRGRLVVQLEMAADGDFYDVKTASPIREDQFKNREPLWERAGTSTPTAGESSPPSPWGQSGADSVPPNAPAAQPITRADVEDAQQQAATLIGERIDAMTAGEVNTIARRFLPTMGVKPTVSKERNKAAVTDFTKVNPMAAADEFGVTLPADVRRALEAEFEGKVVEAGPADAQNPLDYTPKQYADAWLRWVAESNGLPLSEVREMQGDEAGLKAIEQRWVDAAVQEAKSGNPLPSKTLDKLLEVRPNAQLPESAIPAGYQRSQARKQEADEKQARADNRKEVKQGAGEAPPIADFGEKLEGARKDMPPSLKEEVSDEKIASLPLSKIWPSDAHESIEDDAAAALVFAARQEIPAKPRVPSRVRAWVSKVKTYRTLVKDLGKNSLERIEQLSKEKGFHSLDPFFAKVRLLSQLPRETWSRVERVEEYPNAIRYEKDGSKTAVAFSSVTIDGKSRRFEGVGKIGPDEVQAVKEMLGTTAPKKDGLTAQDFEVRGTAKTGYKINRKGDSEYRSLKIFTGEDAAKKALAWRDEHTAELEAAWEAVKARDNVSKAEVRRDENRERTGENRRNGRDVSPEDFQSVFSFRGVQFGNWVGQGADAKSRQGMLNDAYDALLDLSDILGIPSRAISLNGTLGLSFGARGSGKAAAHFEPSNLVINLTKTRGAGSLAHEWFHALDNYFSRMRGGEVAFTGDNNAYRQNNFVTYKPEAAWGKAPITPYTNFMRGGQLRERLQRLPGFTYDANKTLAENAKAAGFERDPNHKDGVRPQVEKAFADLVQALNESPMAKRASSLDKAADGYWGRIIERGARSFENYVISKMAQRGWSNDFLANIRSFDEWMAMGKNAERYPYLKPEEDAPVVAAFDKLFETVETRETEGGNVAMFSRSSESVPQSAAEWLSDTVIADEVEKRIGGFAQQPPIRIRDTAFGQLPGVARNDNVAGAVHDGAIYLFRDQLGDRAAVQRTLFHELFHYGLRKFLTKEQFTGQMMNLYRRDKAIKDEADRWAATADGLRAEEFGGSEYALARGVDEALAILAEPNGGPHLNQTARAMFVRRVTNWLADVAQFLKMDKAAAYLRSIHNSEARAYIQSVFKRLEADVGGNGSDWSEAGGPAFSRATTAGLPSDGAAVGAGFNVDGFLSTMARSAAVTKAAGTTDRAIMDMVREGRAAPDILRLVAGTSKSRFNRQVARLLVRTGATPSVELVQADLGSSDGFKFLGKYSRKNDKMTLTPGAEQQAEHIFMHEYIHAATLRALDRKGLASLQMRRLYEHVKRQGGAAGEYGMKNVGEFVAEAFTNPEFQRALRGITAPPGGTLKTAWDGFVRILRSILGLPQDAHDALSQALELGVAVMREDMALRQRGAQQRQAGDAFVQSPQTRATYEGRIDALFNGGKAQRGTAVLDRSDVMGLLGHPDVPLMLNERHLLDGLATHPEMTAAAWKKVPGWLENPAAVFTDPNHPGRLMVIAPDRIAGYPVLMAVEPNPAPAERGKTDPFQLLVTVFAKTTGDLPALGYLGASGRLLYADTKKAPEVWRRAGGIPQAGRHPGPRAGDIPRTGGPTSGAKKILTEKHLNGWRKANLDADGKGADGGDAYFGAAEATEAARNIGNGIKGLTAASIKKAGKHKWTDWLGLGLQFLGRRQLVEVYGDMLPMAEYDRLAAQMEADKNDVGATADDLARRWGKLPDEGKLADLMHDATLAQIDADSAADYVDGDDKFKSAMLKRQFAALTPEAQKVYREARDSYREHHAQVRQAIRDRIMRSELSESKRAELLRKMDDDFFQKVKGVYFPLARFGQYVVAVKGQDGAVVSVSRAETMAEAENLREEMRKAFPSSQGFAVGRVTLSKDFVANHQMVGRGFVADLYAALEKMDVPHDQLAELEDTIGQLYLSSLPDLSWAKHGIHRKGTPGFSQDARRAFAQNTFHGARYLAKLRYGDLMQSELDSMQKHVDDWRDADDFDQPKAQRVVNEMMKRHDLLMNPVSNPLSTALTSAGFVYYLGLSPAAAMVNLSQTALVAYPVMAGKWGYKKSAEALMKASAEAVAGKNDIRTQLKDADEIAAYDAAVKAGTIDVTQSHDLAGIAQGEDAKVMWKMRPVMRLASYLFHHAERFNRQATFIAAYRLAREAGAPHESAYEQATKATYDGHYDYSSGNRPRVMQGNVARVVLLFKQFAQNMIFTLARNAYQSVAGESPAVRKEARKVFAGLITMHAAAAGVLGLPLVGPLLAVASALGGDDDEPWDAEVALRNMLADAFGDKAAEVIARGFSRLTPWDISGRVGLDKLIFPDVQEGLEGQRWAEQFATGMLGPVIGMGVNAARAAQKMGDGDYQRGLEDLAPVVLRNGLKSFRYWNDGAQDRTGITIKDEVGLSGVLGQAAGFSPSEVRLAFEGKKAVMDEDRRLYERRKELLAKIAKATMAKDDEAKAEAREEIKHFNEKNPGRRINPNHIMQSVHNRKNRIDQAQDGVYLPKSRRDAMQAGRFAFAESE